MNFGQAISHCLSKYVVWQGRASRSEFWFFQLFAFGCYLAASVLDTALGFGAVFYCLTLLGLFLPSLSAAVRRLHDTDRSGWWYWISLIPIVGAILLIVWFCQRGTIGDNQFGGDPVSDSPPVRPGPVTSGDELDRLERLADLRSRGIISDSEFEAQKAAILR